MRIILAAPRRPLVAAVAVGLLLAGLFAIGIPTRTAPPAQASIKDSTQFDPNTLNPQPLHGTGVTNPPGGPQYPALSAVWAFAEIGDRVFVGGMFPEVRESYSGPSHAQSYIAAFDRDSGEWIDTWRPTLNGTVYDLEVTANGTLLVGGSFTTVNGVARTGMVALDPATGAIDGTWRATVETWWGNVAPVVRAFEKVGGQIYAVGSFDHLRVGANSSRVWSAARMSAGSGSFDPSFLPKIRYGAWDIAVDATRGRVHLAGDFDEIDDDTSQHRMGTVDLNGNVVPGIATHEDNSNNQNLQVAIDMATDDRVWVAGAEHIIQVKDAGSLQRLGYMHFGMGCDTFVPQNCGQGTYPGGGDVQVLEEADGWMIAGCHCWNRTAGWDDNMHYSSFTGQRHDREFLAIYDAATAALHPFKPLLRERYYGTWAVHVDANGCLYAGGDYTGDANGIWVGGFAKFCADTQAPTVAGSSAQGEVTLTWTQPSGPGSLPIVQHKVFRDGTFIGAVDGTDLTFTDTNPPGTSHTYVVEAVDSHGRKVSASPTTVGVVLPPPDTQDPSGPLGPDATTNATSVTLTWNESSDNVGVVGYLVHDNYQYLAYVAGASNTTYTHTGLSAGELHRYQIRAKDAAGNTSIPSVRLDVIVGDGVSVPDNMPLNVSPTQLDATTIEVEWDRPTNPGGITGYLVHDNYQYLAYVPGVDNHVHLHSGLTPGSTHQYEIRSQGNGVTSLPTERVRITLN